MGDMFIFAELVVIDLIVSYACAALRQVKALDLAKLVLPPMLSLLG